MARQSGTGVIVEAGSISNDIEDSIMYAVRSQESNTCYWSDGSEVYRARLKLSYHVSNVMNLELKEPILTALEVEQCGALLSILKSGRLVLHEFPLLGPSAAGTAATFTAQLPSHHAVICACSVGSVPVLAIEDCSRLRFVRSA